MIKRSVSILYVRASSMQLFCMCGPLTDERPLAAQSGEDAFYDPVHGGGFHPANDGHQIVVRVYVDEIGAIADMYEGRSGRAWQQLMIGVQKKVHIAIGGFCRCRREGLFYPAFRDQR